MNYDIQKLLHQACVFPESNLTFQFSFHQYSRTGSGLTSHSPTYSTPSGIEEHQQATVADHCEIWALQTQINRLTTREAAKKNRLQSGSTLKHQSKKEGKDDMFLPLSCIDKSVLSPPSLSLPSFHTLLATYMQTYTELPLGPSYPLPLPPWHISLSLPSLSHSRHLSVIIPTKDYSSCHIIITLTHNM